MKADGDNILLYILAECVQRTLLPYRLQQLWHALQGLLCLTRDEKKNKSP